MDEELLLISKTYQADSIGQQIPTEVRKPVWCRISSVSASEWFSGGQNGLKPEYRCEMYSDDYNGEEIVELNGIRYGVYRTYKSSAEIVELYLERKAGV